MNTEELNALKDRAYKCAVEHGFHEEEKSDAFYLGRGGTLTSRDSRRTLKYYHLRSFSRGILRIPWKMRSRILLFVCWTSQE